MGKREVLFTEKDRRVTEIEYLLDEIIFINYEDNSITICDEYEYDEYGLNNLIAGLTRAKELLAANQLEEVE